MKKNRIALFAIMALVLTSCEGFLNVKPRGYDIASKVEHFEGLLLGHENYMLQECFPYMCFDTYTDQDGYTNMYSIPILSPHACNAYKWEKDIFREDETCGEWSSFTEAFYYYNVVINGVLDAEDGTPEKRLALHSEARMMRAYLTYLLSEFFGDVPIIKEATTLGGDYSLHSREEVIDFVLTEMKEAVEGLEDAEEHNLRVFKLSGQALYGKVLFYLGRYSEAETVLASVYESLKTRTDACLVDCYSRIDETGNVNYITYNYENPELLYLFGTMYRLWPAVYTESYSMLLTGVKNSVIKHFFYDLKDTRLCLLTSTKTGKTAYQSFKSSENYGANMKKISSDIGVNVPMVYTMYAECLARNHKADLAKQVLVEFRKTRMNPGHEDLPADVVTDDQITVFAFEESMREQIGFGTTWFDMKRVWNDPLFQYMKDYYVHTVGSETYTLTEDKLYLQYPPSVLLWHPEYNE